MEKRIEDEEAPGLDAGAVHIVPPPVPEPTPAFSTPRAASTRMPSLTACPLF